jgi:dynein heavy chain
MADTWLHELAESCMEFSPKAWEACMDDKASKARNGNAVDDFLGPGCDKGSSLFICVTELREQHQVKVKRSRQVPILDEPEDAPGDSADAVKEGAPAADGSDVSAEHAAEAASSESTALLESKEKEAADAAHESSATSESTAIVADIPDAERSEGEEVSLLSPTKAPAAMRFRTVEEEVTETQVVVRIVVLASIGALPKEVTAEAAAAAAAGTLSASSVVYVIKSRDGSLSPADSSPEGVADFMADAVEAGTLSAGDLLGSLGGLLTEVYSPYFEPQLGLGSSLGKGDGEGEGGMEVEGEASTLAGLTSPAGKTAALSTPRASSVLSGGVASATTGAGKRSSAVPTPQAEDTGLSKIPESVKGDFRSALTRFASSLVNTRASLNGDVRLLLPSCAGMALADPAAAAADEAAKAELCDAVEGWSTIVAGIVAKVVTEETKGPRASSELEFWRQRSAQFTTLFDAVNAPAVRACIAALDVAREGGLVDRFRGLCTELTRAHVEARDNVKFLSTLDRHFKALSVGSLPAIVDTLPSLLNGLRMVWIISRHYNTEDTMLPLLKRVGAELADRAAADVSIKGILRLARSNPDEAATLLTQAGAMLTTWHSTFLSVRERIERTSEHRWEFDRRALFERTDHIASVLGDLKHVVQTASQLSRFYRGNELKAVSDDPTELGAITKRVDKLTLPLTRLLYNAYDKSKHGKWRADKDAFDHAVDDIERRTEAFIARAFEQLRSAEGAADLLAKFRAMDVNMRASLRALLEGNTANIVARARRELSVAAAAFESRRASPPLYKNNPPVAGAIAWANAVYQRQKKPILKLRAMPGLFEAAGGPELKEEYLAFARSVDGYVKVLHTGWCDAVAKSTGDLMRQAVLGPALLKEPLGPRAILARVAKMETTGAEGQLRSMLIAAAAAAAATGSTPSLQVDKEVARIPAPPFVVNFSPALSTVVRECRLLDRLGFTVPEVGMNVALQEERLNGYVARLNSMLERYHSTLAGLKPIEANLLQVQLGTLRAALRPGFSPLNWNSLHIDAYSKDVSRALQDFDGTLQQVRKSVSMLEDAEAAIAGASLISPSDFDGKSLPVDAAELFDIVEKARTGRLEGLVHRYASTRAVMQQVEGLIAGTDTCVSPVLAEFYRYWERRFYNAITRMTLTSMATFQALLNSATLPPGAAAAVAAAHGGVLPRFPALVRVRATYSAPDVVLSPDLAQVGKFLRRCVYALIKSSNAFTRWMDGTCLEASVAVPVGEAAPDFSYFEDIRQNPEVVALLMSLNPAVIKVFNAVKAATTHWGRYGSSYGLWAARKPEAEKRMLEKAPPASFFDTRLAVYARLAEGVDSLPAVRDVGFMRLDCQPVAAAIKAQAGKLSSDFARGLLDIATRRLHEFSSRISDMQAGMSGSPSDLPSLKAVLSAIALTLDSKGEMELLVADIGERFRVLELYGVDVEAEAAKLAASSPSDWAAAVDLALTKDARLVKVKDRFREVTVTDVLAFVTEADALRKSFTATGPTASGVTLPTGLAALSSFRSRLAAANVTREALSSAERLFGLPLTRFTQLGEVKDEMDRVAPLYALYSEQVAFTETNATTLWAELDTPSLQRGAEDLVKKLSKLRDLKGSSVYTLVADNINGFKDSLPLLASLKNPAMKERHWDSIGALCGVKIVFNPKSFTLSSIFALRMERFASGVEEIVNEAKQEGKIEKDLKAIIDKWAATAFGVTKYMKNGEARGHVLKPADEIKLDLDDSLLNLQAMAGSRFVGIFAASVGEWEKKLNLVSEVQDVWYVVQTKWAYLEGIFVGSEDIKAQLPEEAKRFGKIDAEFKAIMTATVKNPNVVDACCEPGRLGALGALGGRLDACQKSLSEYLNTKRNAFARFFFISDDELLSVLGSSDPTSIRVHLLKLFDNVKDFTFGRGGKAITGMGSSEGESFTLVNPSPVEGAVEVWMTQAEGAMRSSLQAISKEGVFSYAHASRLDWIAEQLGMVVCAGSQIWWTWETEDVFRRVRKGDKYAMKSYAERQTKQLLELVARVRDDIPRLLRVKVNTLLIVDVHARDIIDSFVRDSILDAREFAWESQLRFYWNKDVDDIVISQCTGNFRYGYEYMGLNGRLVITPLTDRCYMTLTQALTFNLGGAPAGPAGTGKTETTKDLAKNLAVPCFVINCG